MITSPPSPGRNPLPQLEQGTTEAAIPPAKVDGTPVNDPSGAHSVAQRVGRPLHHERALSGDRPRLATFRELKKTREQWRQPDISENASPASEPDHVEGSGTGSAQIKEIILHPGETGTSRTQKLVHE